MQKTNAMRMLDKANISYQVIEYDVDLNDLSGMHTAALLHKEAEALFKTLVLMNDKQELFVCCLPSSHTLDLKKAATAFHSKKVEMLPMKMLCKATGYIRGGCSPIGMKHELPTFIDEMIILFNEIYISAGKRGLMLQLHSKDLIAFCHAKVVELCKC